MNDPAAMPDPVDVLGVSVSPFESYPHAVACIERRIREKEKTFCVAINPEKVYRAQHDAALREVLAQAQIKICDGVGVAIGMRLLHGKKATRCTGVDLFLHLMARAAQTGLRVFLLGAAPPVNQQAAENLVRRFPGLQIAGRQDGYFTDDADVVAQINASGADMLFVAMGSPRQEYWIASHRAAIEAPFCMGVGGTLDVISGQVRRAPAVFRRTGTEFLYRLIREPRRWRRQMILPVFLVQVLVERVRQQGRVTR